MRQAGDVDRYQERMDETVATLSAETREEAEKAVAPDEVDVEADKSAAGMSSGDVVMTDDGAQVGVVAFVERDEDGAARTVWAQSFEGDSGMALHPVPAEKADVEGDTVIVAMSEAEFAALAQ